MGGMEMGLGDSHSNHFVGKSLILIPISRQNENSSIPIFFSKDSNFHSDKDFNSDPCHKQDALKFILISVPISTLIANQTCPLSHFLSLMIDTGIFLQDLRLD